MVRFACNIVAVDVQLGTVGRVAKRDVPQTFRFGGAAARKDDSVSAVVGLPPSIFGHPADQDGG